MYIYICLGTLRSPLEATDRWGTTTGSIYVYMHIYMYVYMHVHTYTYTYMCVYLSMSWRFKLDPRGCRQVRNNHGQHICIHAYIYVCV